MKARAKKMNNGEHEQRHNIKIPSAKSLSQKIFLVENTNSPYWPRKNLMSKQNFPVYVMSLFSC